MMKQIMLYLCVVAVMCLAIAFSSYSKSYTMNDKNSEVTFSGEHAGMAFSGVFEKWQAKLTLPPAQAPKIIAEFQMTSAKTGDFTYDSTLPEGDWFDTDNHPVGIFESTQINKTDNGYQVEGMLTLRGISKPQTFTLFEFDQGFNAQFKIDRLVYQIGYDSDPEAEWVSRHIVMELNLVK